MRGKGDAQLGTRIRQLRERRGLSQERTAHRAGKSEHWLVDVEAGRADPRYSDLIELARVLEVDLVDVLPVSQRRTNNVADRRTLAGREDIEAKRREFLGLVGGMLTLGDPEQLAAALDSGAAHDAGPMAGAAGVNRRLLDDVQAFVSHCGEHWGRVTPRSLLPAVRSNLAFLRGLLPMPMTPVLRRYVQVVAAETASEAGWLSRQLDNRGDATGYWSLARELAREAGEHELVARVLVAASSLYSTVTGRPDGDGATALTLLDQAEALAGPRSSPGLRSWILARRAEEGAAAGDTRRSVRDFDQAERLLSGAFGSSGGILADWDGERLALWRAHCVIHLYADPPAWALADAVTVLERALSDLNPSRLYDRSRAMIELAEAYVRQREVEAACALLADTLSLALDVGLMSHVGRVRRVRQRLVPWQGTAAVTRLDEQLRLTH